MRPQESAPTISRARKPSSLPAASVPLARGLEGSGRMLIVNLCEEASGASMLEYLFLAGLLGLAAVVTMSGATRALSSSFNTLGSAVQSSVTH